MKAPSPPPLQTLRPSSKPKLRPSAAAPSNDFAPAPLIWEDAWAAELDHLSSDNRDADGEKLDASTGTNVVVFESAKLPQSVNGSGREYTESPLKQILANINARAISPRQMQALSLELYVGGIISWDEHAALAFQPDLHPDFARTIGALTGEKPLPDQPRDFVREWEQKLDFERRFAPATSRAKEHALHILSVLRRIESPASLLT